MDLTKQLTEERRARLAAEHTLEDKRTELYEANRKIAVHARTLTDEIIEQRSEAEALKGENAEVREHLERAESAMVIAERRLWESLETIEDGFAVFDKDDVLIGANRAYLAVFDGLEDARPGASADELLDLLTSEGIVDTEGTDPNAWREMMRARWAEDQIEPIVIRLWNGRSVRLVDRRTRDGDMVTLALDITDTIRREKDLRAARDQAEAASRAKSAFLANMSHEIRTPMNGVLGMVQMLEDTELSDEQKLYVETIRSSGEALLVIVNDILDYSKIEADKLALRLEPFDLERCIHEVVTLLRPAAAEKGLEVTVDYDLFLPTAFVGDPGRSRQVLTNLAGNAVKFTETGHVLLRAIGLPGEDGGVRQVHIVVEDTGIGIAEDRLGHVFGEFNQAENDRDRSYDGTGLGLTISRRLVELMGGDIWVHSEQAVGSAFGFSLALPEPEGDAATPPALPDWLNRAVLIGPPGPERDTAEKQLAALGLQVVAEGEDGDVVLSQIGVEVPGALPVPALRSELASLLAGLPKPERPEPLAPAADEVAGPEDAGTASGPRRMRVLAAEDNRTNRLVFSKMVKALDIDLEFAENGLEAVEAFRRAPPDILFTDISMPLMDGKEAARRIREIETAESLSRMPIVAITAHAMEGDAEDILAAGVDYYLAKPLRKATLIEYILAAQPDGTLPVLTEEQEGHAPEGPPDAALINA